MTTATQTIDPAVLDLIADEAVLRYLSQIVAVERKTRDLYATAIESSDPMTKTYPTMADAAFALVSVPESSAEGNTARRERQAAKYHYDSLQSDAFDGLQRRLKMVAENLVRAEVSE